MEHLSNFPNRFSYDENGVVSIDGTTYPGSNIKELLPLLFQPIGRQSWDIKGLYEWIEMLHSLGLTYFMKNPGLRCFIGENMKHIGWNSSQFTLFLLGPVEKPKEKNIKNYFL